MTSKEQKEEMSQIFKQFQKKYKQLKEVKLEFKQDEKFKYQGRSQINIVGSFTTIGKNRFKKIQPISIELIEGIGNIKYTLLHEITHCISKYRERKIKDEWIVLDHGDDFYKNYHEVLKYAFELKIIEKKFEIHEIKKFDIRC